MGVCSAGAVPQIVPDPASSVPLHRASFVSKPGADKCAFWAARLHPGAYHETQVLQPRPPRRRFAGRWLRRRRAPGEAPAQEPAPAEQAVPADSPLLTPANLTETAPETYQVRFETSVGPIVVQVNSAVVAQRRGPLLQPGEERLLR